MRWIAHGDARLGNQGAAAEVPEWVRMFAALALGGSVCVLDDAGAPVARALVVFRDTRGATDEERSGADCHATSRGGFAATSAVISRDGFVTMRVTLTGTNVRIVLARVLPTIGTVGVGTGTPASLHESPLAASLLDRAALAAAPGMTTDRILRELPGFDRSRSNSAFTNYGQLRASFSGAGTDRGAVFVDGVPAQDGFGGQIDWQAYPAATIERVELLRGAGSSLYGSGAIGGVLDLTTFGPRTASSHDTNGKLAFEGGSSDEAASAFALRGAIGGTVAASIDATSARLAYSDLPPAYSTPIDHVAKSTSGTFSARARFDDASTTVAGAILAGSDHQDEGRPNYRFDRSFRQESASVARQLGNGSARLTYFVRDATVENLSDVFPTKPGALRYDQHVPTHEEGFTTSYELAAGAWDTQLRIDERRVTGRSEQFGSADAFQALGTGVEASQGIALQTEYRARRFELNAGARADHLRYDDLVQSVAASPARATTTLGGHDENAISPRLALRYDVGSRLALRVSAGGGFRGPYLNELVRGFNVGKIFEAPNLALVPERSTTASAGADYELGAGRIAFDAVETHVHDAIAFVTLSPTLMMRENVDRTQSDSETLSYVAPLSACTRLRVSGTRQRATVTNGPAAAIGKTLAFVPNSQADIALDANGRGGFGFAVDASYVGQTYADDVGAQPLGAALLFGATVRATTTSGTSFALLADNLTRQRYRSSIDRYGPPQTLALRVSFPLGPTQARIPGCS